MDLKAPFIMTDSLRTVVVISTHAALLERLVRDAGFSVAGTADTMINGERLVEFLEPAYVIVDSDLPGGYDFSAIGSLRRLCPQARILLVVNQRLSMSDTSALGAVAVLARDDLLELGPLLRDLESAAATSNRNLERRRGRDRRRVQDWSRTGWEYRQRIRRADDRRDDRTYV